jgi:hypothetical protein
MATDTIISNAAAIAACDAIVDLLDAGSAAGHLKIYSAGSGVPADVDTAITDQVLLADLTLSDPAFGGAADNTGKATATASSITADSSANASGTAAFFRAEDSNGVARIQGTVGTSDCDLNLNSVAISSGAQVSITSWTFSVPEQV